MALCRVLSPSALLSRSWVLLGSHAILWLAHTL